MLHERGEIDKYNPQELGEGLGFSDQKRNIAAGLLVTTTAILAGITAGVATGELKLPFTDEAGYLSNVVLGDAFFVYIAARLFRSYQVEARLFANAARERSLTIKKNMFTRSISTQ